MMTALQLLTISTTPPFLIPFVCANASSNNLSSATGQILIPLGEMWTAAIASTAGSSPLGSYSIVWEEIPA